jgi:hypothetical protein
LVINLLRGFSSNFPNAIRSDLTNRMIELSGEKFPTDINKNPLDFIIGNKGVGYK